MISKATAIENSQLGISKVLEELEAIVDKAIHKEYVEGKLLTVAFDTSASYGTHNVKPILSKYEMTLTNDLIKQLAERYKKAGWTASLCSKYVDLQRDGYHVPAIQLI